MADMFQDADGNWHEVNETPQPNRAMRRSWSRTKKKPGQYDAKFDYEGATVYMVSLDKEKRDELKKQEKELSAKAKEIQSQIAAETDADKKEALEESVIEMQLSFGGGIVKRSVVGWEGGDEPYSAEALDDLPLEIINDWVPLILEKSVFGKTQKEILGNASTA